MKLHYFHGRGPLRALVMVREQRRVELFIKPVGEDIWALVALSGSVDGQRLARTIRTDRDASAGKFHFDPDQYEPIG